MKQVAGSYSSGQLTLDVDAFRIDHVRYADHGSGGQSGLVHPAQDHGMTVAVDDSGGQVHAFALDDLATLGSLGLQVRADGGDLSIFDQ